MAKIPAPTMKRIPSVRLCQVVSRLRPRPLCSTSCLSSFACSVSPLFPSLKSFSCSFCSLPVSFWWLWRRAQATIMGSSWPVRLVVL